MNVAVFRTRFMMLARKTLTLNCCLLILAGFCGCATVRVTDPYYTATQLFLESEASRKAVDQITVNELRDRKVFVDTTYLTTAYQSVPSLSFNQVPQDYLYLVADLRARLLLSGVRLVEKRADADVVLEVRTGGVGVDHQEFLLGLTNLTIPTEGVANVPIQTPELAIIKSTKQFGFASIAVVAYWQDTGEIIASSGPFIGRTAREDYWILGIGPRTVGNIPPAEKPGPQNAGK
jgi:Family of unknown function (DUF6655)